MTPPGRNTPEQRAREGIDRQLAEAGWVLQDWDGMYVGAAKGVAVREFRLKPSGFADYLLFVDEQAMGVVEAKPEGHTLSGVEPQARDYAGGLPTTLTVPVRPLPFLYLSTGVETQFTNLLDPEPKSRPLFNFHRPETLAEWTGAKTLAEWTGAPQGASVVAETATAHAAPARRPSSLRSRLRAMPPRLDRATMRLWPAQDRAIQNLEVSLAKDRQRALIQMATGSGKTYTTVSAIARLLAYANPRRVLFLVDRKNLGEQAEAEFRRYRLPWNGRLFTEEWNVQLLQSNTILDSSKVVITTIQRLYAALRGEEELPPDVEEGSQFTTGGPALREPIPVAYSPRIPPEFFDVVFVDECHRSIYSVWGQVLTYFDAFLVGLTATPSNHTYGFFNGNLVMEYGHEQAVADGVNVDFEVYRLRTRISEQGGSIRADGETMVRFRDRMTRKDRWEKPGQDIDYAPEDLDRGVVAVDQIRTLVTAFRDRLATEIFPGRTEVPKTLVFCKDDSHAEDTVRVLRDVFGKGNDFAQKITYRTTGKSPRDLLQEFRTAYNPRIAVTVDMIATGTDIKPVEIVLFLREVKSRIFFEQMKGRGVRVCDETELKSVTPDARGPKDHFVLVDCVGVCDEGTDLADTQPLERRPSVPLKALLETVAAGSTDPDLLSSVASRLARLDRRCGPEERKRIQEATGGSSLASMTMRIMEALDPDRIAEAARTRNNFAPDAQPTVEQKTAAQAALLKEAAKPIAANPGFRHLLEDLRRSFEQVIDELTRDELTEAGFSAAARARAQEVVRTFEEYIAEHREEFEALRFYYSRPAGTRLRYEDVKELEDALRLHDRRLTEPELWRAYAARDEGKVQGDPMERRLADLLSLVRYALRKQPVLAPYADDVKARFVVWMDRQRQAGRTFTEEQVRWLEMMRDHVATSLEITVDDFDLAPFVEEGGLGRAAQVFGKALRPLVQELNQVLAA